MAVIIRSLELVHLIPLTGLQLPNCHITENSVNLVQQGCRRVSVPGLIFISIASRMCGTKQLDHEAHSHHIDRWRTVWKTRFVAKLYFSNATMMII